MSIKHLAIHMNITIVPAILTDNEHHFQHAMEALYGAASWVQIDIMDGAFVENRSIPLPDMRPYASKLSAEAHLMVQHPNKFIEDCVEKGYQRIYVHYEAFRSDLQSISNVIKKIHDHGVEAGIALNPQTPIMDLLSEEELAGVESLLILGVTPGRQGQAFQANTLMRISEAKTRFPQTEIAVDGGVKQEHLKEVLMAGATRICIGSAIVMAQDPKEALKEFERLAQEYASMVY